MGNLYNVIAFLCKKNNIKGAKMCDDIGISKGLLTDLKMGRRTGVSAVTAQKIASYFGVSVGYLLGEEEDKKEEHIEFDDSSKEDKEFFERLSTMTDEEKQILYSVAQAIAERRKQK